ncbi:allophanate hydrolase [Pseudonocardia dioxanivorans]|uniref:allophanate hydrolase n=1 Tax=Pseudonocardia dioxanivorans TaxID=240495 RepID=UPI000CD03859|nr:allophanate hydrolase [Pseudonocardia dioxanivorans]
MGEVVDRALRALKAAHGGPPEVWITLRDEDAVVRSATEVERRVADGQRLPLPGMTVAVKDNIDVAGVETTAGCPAYAYLPAGDAPAVAGLVAAGAVVIGKTNLDQFATGLVGTRSPYGAVRNAVDPRYVSGGSSSGSAVAVALDQVDVALGTDTAGSGRVPAAFNGIVGLKPTRGLLSTRGVVPACASLDCVSVFARSVPTAHAAAVAAWAGDPSAADPGRRPPARPPGRVRTVGVPDPAELDLSDEYRPAWEATVERLRAGGITLRPLAMADLLAAGALLYEGGLVAERYAAVGAFLAAHPHEVDPTVRAIIGSAAEIPAHRLAADLHRLVELRRRTAEQFRRFDAFVLPATPLHPLIEEVAADPVGVNQRLGTYNNFCNLLDLCALTLPAGRTSAGLPFGVTVYAGAFADAALVEFGSAFTGDAPGPYPVPPRPLGTPDTPHRVAVAGAHLRGQPLNGQLLQLGARFLEQTTTAPKYRLYALPTEPAKPGLVATDDGDGVAVEVEVWAMSDAGFADLVASVPPPLAIGRVETAAGDALPGFVCQAGQRRGADDISAYGGWRAYLRGDQG